MRKIFVLFVLIACANAAFAAEECSNCLNVKPRNCAYYTVMAAPNYRDHFYTCQTCNSGYKIESGYVVTGDDIMPTMAYNYCVEDCKGCTNCNNIGWTSANTGYQVYKTASCSCNKCVYVSTYRCAGNYFGSSTNGTSGCSPCPDGGLSSPGSTAKTACYKPAGSTGVDSTGSYTYMGTCIWKN